MSNQEAKGEVSKDRERNCNSRELHIPKMPNKDVSKWIDPIIAQNIKRYWPSNSPQLYTLQVTNILHILKIVDPRIIPAHAGRQHFWWRVVELGGSQGGAANATVLDQRWLHVKCNCSFPRCWFCRGWTVALPCFFSLILFVARNFFNFLSWSVSVLSIGFDWF